MTEVVSVEEDGADAARIALEECIRDGGVAIFPADTLYGLACDPLSESVDGADPPDQGPGRGQVLGGDVLLAAGDA